MTEEEREPREGLLRIGTWNISGWSPEKAVIIAEDVHFDVLALQETHLARFPLERAHSTAKALHLRLHHGRPVPPLASSEHGRSCGVGFVAGPGIAL